MERYFVEEDQGRYSIHKRGRHPGNPMARCKDPTDAREIAAALNTVQQLQDARALEYRGTGAGLDRLFETPRSYGTLL